MNIILEKYKGQSTRFTCPSCGEKRAFTRYIDTISNSYINENVGKCNHIIGCGYHLSPKQFFENNPHLRTGDKNYITPPLEKKKELVPINSIEVNTFLRTLNKSSNFMEFLGKVFDKETSERLFGDYYLGGTENKEVIFWQIDKSLRIRTGKIIQYDPNTGKRNRRGELNSPNINWVHSALKKQGKLPDKWQLTQCLFGEHLINKYPHKPICLVESEKTSIIMSGFEPEFNWVATGGVQNLNKERIYPIRNHPIMAFPDLKCFELWKEKADKINSEIGSTIRISHYLEDIATKEERDQGLDIADYMLKRC
ncbi:MAG: hypothetical protein H6Q15_1719 [Bacteroidetes bacterium]|nr:hypothetical protein [Bacteroidota bacterium]